MSALAASQYARGGLTYIYVKPTFVSVIINY
jgi:hypothetical protein